MVSINSQTFKKSCLFNYNKNWNIILEFYSLIGGTEDFKAIKPEAGHISDLENLIKVSKEKSQQIFLELDPNHSSVDHPWFKRSVEREDPFTSYYVWADGIIGSNGGKERRSPPNNWVSH